VPERPSIAAMQPSEQSNTALSIPNSMSARFYFSPSPLLLTRVGAILLLFSFPCPSISRSLSLASLFMPAPLTLLAELLGVWGGVVIGNPLEKLDDAAVILGTVPPTSVGLLMTVEASLWCTTDACVAMDDVEFDRVGDEGRPAKNELFNVTGGVDGAADKGLEEVRWWLLIWSGEGGATCDVGVFCAAKGVVAEATLADDVVSAT